MIVNVKYMEYNGSFYKIIEETCKGYADSRIITNRMVKVDAIPDQKNTDIFSKTMEENLEKREHIKNTDGVVR